MKADNLLQTVYFLFYFDHEAYWKGFAESKRNFIKELDFCSQFNQKQNKTTQNNMIF